MEKGDKMKALKMLVMGVLFIGFSVLVPKILQADSLLRWSITDSCASDTTITITKAATEGKTWVITDVSGGGTQNGYLRIEINDVEKWRLYFPGNGSTGQKVRLKGSPNQKVEATVILSTSGDAAVNMAGYKE